MLNQNFPVIYQGNCYMVDASHLCNSSCLFKSMIESKVNQDIDLKKLRLIITYEEFSPRNINNFLRICQNLPTDVQNSEIIEICEISLMFQAEKIYNTSINFIHANVDSEFSIPFDKFHNINFLKIESIEPAIIHHVDNLDALEFDDNYDSTQTDVNDNNKRINDDIGIMKKEKSVFYQIKIEKELTKCRRFLFYRGEEVLFAAKQKINQVFICDGKEIHINDKKTKKRAIITQNTEGYNIASIDDQIIRINYYRTNPSQFKKYFSLKLSFINNDIFHHWTPKVLKKPEQLYGSYNHHPIKSKKNIILQNKEKHTTLIVRKMSKKLYEVECHSSISPIIVFSIAISQIIGPYLV